MRKHLFSLVIGLVFSTLSFAQQKDAVLLTIDNEPVYTSEFKRVYLKNIDLVKDESQKNIDEYLNLFINYKLKLKEARDLGLDKNEKYVKELEGYRKQLASGYLTDNNASEALVKEAYDRLQERVNASHILIRVDPNAAPKDSLVSYQKISDLRDKVNAGENFNDLAKQFSEDPSAKDNGGDLGWFSAFRMVYPFEDAAYKTEVGKVSKPFRTRFGYHILKVNDREKTLGEVEVAHIMVAFNKETSEEKAKEKIDDISQQLKQNASFESLAKQYSDDRNTAVNGGKIKRFGQGALNSEEFEKVAFGLTEPGDISEPVKTKYGWHIVKLIQKYPPKTFEEMQGELTQKIKRDSRSQLISESFINSLKEKYGVKRNTEAIDYFKKILPDSMFVKSWEIPAEDKNMEKPMLTLGKDSFDYQNFAEFLIGRGSGNNNFKDVSVFVDTMYDQYESSTLLKYYEDHLEEDNQEFANVISEYKDGLLIFDLMEDKIWNAAKNDSIALQKFYERRKNSYVQNESYKVIKASSSNEESITKVKLLLEKGKSLEEIKKEVNPDNKANVIFSEEELVKGEDSLVDGVSGEKGQILISSENNYFTLIQIKETLPSRIKTFEETKGKVINDFQDDLEKKWLAGLREKYEVKVNKKTLKNIKKELTL